jgi:ferredoxin
MILRPEIYASAATVGAIIEVAGQRLAWCRRAEAIESGRPRSLEAALHAGVSFSHGCGAGECGGCKCSASAAIVAASTARPSA